MVGNSKYLMLKFVDYCVNYQIYDLSTGFNVFQMQDAVLNDIVNI